MTQPIPHAIEVASAKQYRRALNGWVRSPRPAQTATFDASNAGLDVRPHFGVAGPRQLTLKPRQTLRVDRDALGAHAVASALVGELERDTPTA
jgi:hypothetical protein